MADNTNNNQPNEQADSNVVSKATVDNTNATTSLTAILGQVANSISSLDKRAEKIENIFKAFETAIKSLGEKIQENTNEQKENNKEKRKKETEGGFGAGLTTKILSKFLPKEFSTGLKHFSDIFKKARAGGMGVLGSTFKALGPATILQLTQWGVEATKRMAGMFLSTTATRYRMSAISPFAEERGWNNNTWMYKRQLFKRMGYKDEEISDMFTRGEGKGMDYESIRVSAGAQKYYGLQGADDYALNMMRRAGVASAHLSKAFGALRITANAAGMGMQEMSDFQKSYIGSVKGGGFKVGTFNAMMKELSPLIKTGQITGSELAGLMDITHRTSQTQLMGLAQFAKRGGYKFDEEDLLSISYDLRRIQGGDVSTQLPFLRSVLKGFYQARGISSFNQASKKDREIILENFLAPLGFDISKIPDAPKIIDMIMKNQLDNEGKKILEEASTSETEKTNNYLQGMAEVMYAISEPVQYIKELLWTQYTKPHYWWTNDEQLKKDIEARVAKDQEPIELILKNQLGKDVKVEAKVAGTKAKVKSES